VCSPEESHCEKRCKIQGGGQGMVVMAKISITTILGNFKLGCFGLDNL